MQLLTNASIDIIELGFLRTEKTNADRTVWNNASQMQELLQYKGSNHLFAAMILHNKYDIQLLEPQDRSGIDIIRVTFHDYDYEEGIAFCNQVKKLGYAVSCNPINIMGYSDRQLLDLLDKVNEMNPYAFSIVDTFGSMDNKDLDRLVSICHHNLKPEITLGLHLHENKAQSFSLAQRFIDKHLNRNTIIDGSLNGMGRVPGNLSIELLADYLNTNFGTRYEIDYLLDAIEQYIEPIKEQSSWGYSPVYFLSAKYNLHRNYAEYYLDKGNLTHKDINHLLSKINEQKKTAFDSEYAEKMYENYIIHEIDDSCIRKLLADKFSGQNVLLLAPGKSLRNCQSEVEAFCQQNHPIIIAINFIPSDFEPNFIFYTNAKRLSQYGKKQIPVIATSNLSIDVDFMINFNGIISTFKQGNNSLIMLLRLLKESGVAMTGIAGADGYSDEGMQYFDSNMHSYTKHNNQFNEEMRKAIQRIDMKIKFVTKSQYE